MQPDDGRKKSPYKGVILIMVLLAIVPFILTILFSYVINKFQYKYPKELNNASAIVFGCTCGLLFHLICIFTGLFKGTLKVVVSRIFNFFDNLKISFKVAKLLYIEDLKTNGAIFWFLFPIVSINLFLIIKNFLVCLKMLGYM